MEGPDLGGRRLHEDFRVVVGEGDVYLWHFGDLAIPALVTVGMVLVLLCDHLATLPVAFSGLRAIDLLKELGDSSHSR